MARSIARAITSFSKQQIDLVFQYAKRIIKKRGLDIRLAPKQQDIGKILVVVPSKSGTAPQRNLFKRRIKSIFYEESLFEKGFDCIVFANKQAMGISFHEIRTLLLEAYQSTKIEN